MNKLGRGSIAIVIACAIFAFSRASWAQQPLKVGGAEPWVVRDQGSNASGLFVDLINAIAKDAGLKVDYESMIFADLIPALKDGKIDIIATFVAITPERQQQVDFSVPIYNAPTEAVVVKASDTTDYKTLADLKGHPVGAQKGSVQLALLQRTGGFSESRSTTR